MPLLQGHNAPGPNFVLVDLRRNDSRGKGSPTVSRRRGADVDQGGTIRTSLNLPAQSLYPSIPTLYDVFRAAQVKTVIWYCGSSRGRGSRAAGWLGDQIAEKGDTQMRSVILGGGIKGWVAGGESFTAYMSGYEADKWVNAAE
ncbi:uncharacterized protein VDAG_08723 [Verticillium dahliae VdLs.17]|uniref:Rhodanese domain-containing protein n=1 Tax=Verticillium dahliae (strain VdLs.17 / ATCC MYA-4575 / FGSC 10137) TaxID=498257 RepID=G2XEZ1_VERDV|nr:uncharacterized protein VDAG_08723 [Verticillium dahliae VdLs.17]EGY18389.1 hypothetical protein VDAG_08723 [Verticillium dahliae VdLs.17]